MHKPPLNVPGPSIFTFERPDGKTATRPRTFAQLAIAQREAQEAATRADVLALVAYVTIASGAMFLAGMLTDHFIW